MKRHLHLAHSINSVPWHIRSESALGYLPAAIAFMTGKTDPSAYMDDGDEIKEKKNSFAERFIASTSVTAEPYIKSYYYDYPPMLISDVLVIPVMGAIDKEDYCGWAGTKTIQSWYELAKTDERITGIVELCDSGGGSVLGTSELAQYKVDYPKPIVELCEGVMCSAMQYIAAGSDWIMATSKSCIVGSVGVMTSFVSFQKYYEEMGIEFRDIYSKTSELKNFAYRQAQQGDDTAYTDGILFKLDESFMAFMKQRRPGISQDALKGADYTAEQGIKEGLVDEIGNLDMAIAKVRELAGLPNTNSNSNTNTMKKVTMTVNNAAAAILKATVKDIEIEDVEETNEEQETQGEGETVVKSEEENTAEESTEGSDKTSDENSDEADKISPEAAQRIASLEAQLKKEKADHQTTKKQVVATKPSLTNVKQTKSDVLHDEDDLEASLTHFRPAGSK